MLCQSLLHIMATTPVPFHIMAATTVPIHFMGAMPEHSHATAITPESPHATDTMPESPHIMGFKTFGGGYIPQALADTGFGPKRMRIVYSVEDRSSPVASAFSSPVLPEFVPLST